MTTSLERHERPIHTRLTALKDNRLTCDHAGRYKPLSQLGGQVIKERIA